MSGFHVCNSKLNEFWNPFWNEACNSTELQDWKKNWSNLSMLTHRMHTKILLPHRNNTVHFERYYIYCKLHSKLWQGTEMIRKTTVSPTVIFAAFYRCWFEYVVCSEIEDGNTAEHCRLSQCDTEHYRKLQAVRMWQRTL